MSKASSETMSETIGRNTSRKRTHAKSLAKGLAAGLIGGLVATLVKSLAEKVYPPHTHGEPESLVEIEGTLAAHELALPPKQATVNSLHWSVGALTGAAYGAVAEFYPDATAKDGAAFGMTLASFAHEGALPILGFGVSPEAQAAQTSRQSSSEMASHIVFGVVTETVRRVVRRILR